ncbi:btk-binding protein-related [Anaeramoeba flamelloides]|uniref:Btk-binding protein-related n=1 Tax=Anaeramoeba flamelloides TaxID=1746091 RepID=A0ABQ8YNB2_9EUKA|nr:btk-binding protein-related [Anaeramoeba flamelloides]
MNNISKCWGIGDNSRKQFKSITRTEVTKYTLFQKEIDIQLLTVSDRSIFYYCGNRVFCCDGRYFQPTNSKMEPLKLKIIKMRSTNTSHVMLTKCGRCLFLSVYNEKQKLSEVDFFYNNNLKVIDISCGSNHTLCLCSNGELYGFGSNSNNLLSSSTTDYDPVLISSDVILISEGKSSEHYFFMKKNTFELYARGYNAYGQLGNGEISNRRKCMQNYLIKPPLDNKKIKKIYTGWSYSIILVGRNYFYTTGAKFSNGTYLQRQKFKKLNFLRKSKVRDVAVGAGHCMVTCTNNLIFGFGRETTEMRFGVDGVPERLLIPRLKLKPTEELHAISGGYFSVAYTITCSPVKADFKKLFQSRLFSDCKISKFKVHKPILEVRLNANIQQIIKILELLTDNEILELLEWVYFEEINSVSVYNTLELFNIDFETMGTLSNDIKKLLTNQVSKDLILNISQNNNNLRINEEIPVHKCILAARSNFFSKLFRNQKNKEKVTLQIDGFSIQTIKCLIRFLYSGKLFLRSKTKKKENENENENENEIEKEKEKEKEKDKDKEEKKEKIGEYEYEDEDEYIETIIDQLLNGMHVFELNEASRIMKRIDEMRDILYKK